jgi:succinate dehydrogenase / fumarate reductase flavoprotein subunit
MTEGSINAALGNVDPQDNWKYHFKDTMVEGQMLSDYRMIEILVKEAPDRILELEKMGTVFDRTKDDKIDQRFFWCTYF